MFLGYLTFVAGISKFLPSNNAFTLEIDHSVCHSDVRACLMVPVNNEHRHSTVCASAGA